MSDSYRAIYDAVRSRIVNGDIGSAVESVMRDANFPFYVERAMCSIQEAASEYQRPSAVFRPTLGIDGNKWCALYGPNIQEGVCGFGDSPAEAMYDFDRNWVKRIEREREEEA